jgi:hypothetical protein
MSYVNLVLMIVVMMTVVAIVAVPIVPIIRPIVVAVVRIWPVVAVWIIAISVSRITNSDADSANANRYLSV